MVVYWTDEAQADIVNISNDLLRTSPWHAQDVLYPLFKQIEQLANFPETGQPYRPDYPRQVRQLLLGEYRLIYRVEIEQIVVLTIRCQV